MVPIYLILVLQITVYYKLNMFVYFIPFSLDTLQTGHRRKFSRCMPVQKWPTPDQAITLIDTFSCGHHFLLLPPLPTTGFTPFMESHSAAPPRVTANGKCGKWLVVAFLSLLLRLVLAASGFPPFLTIIYPLPSLFSLAFQLVVVIIWLNWTL